MHIVDDPYDILMFPFVGSLAEDSRELAQERNKRGAKEKERKKSKGSARI